MVPLGDIIREEYESMPEPADGEASLERLEKRQKYLKDRVEFIIKKLEEITSKKGGFQPNDSLDVVEQGEEGEMIPTDIGDKLLSKVEQEREVTSREVDSFFLREGYDRSTSTVLKKMKNLDAVSSLVEYKNGDGRGTGGNQPAKLVAV